MGDKEEPEIGKGLKIMTPKQMITRLPILLAQKQAANNSQKLNNEIRQIIYLRKNIFACLFSVHNTISLSRHEQVCLMRLRFERYFSHILCAGQRIYQKQSINI